MMRLALLSALVGYTLAKPQLLELHKRERREMPPSRHRMLKQQLTGENGEKEQGSKLGTGYGTHYTFLHVGTPPQKVSVIVDTGSHWTAFPCSQCTECGRQHTDPNFNEQKSSTFEKVSCDACEYGGSCYDNKCHISLSYMEGSSWHAYEARDLVALGENDPISYVFGCQVAETSLFQDQLENGIMGLNHDSLTIINRLSEKGQIDAKILALCMEGDSDPPTSKGGSMMVGGYDSSIHLTPITFTPLLSAGRGMYNVNLEKITLATKGGDNYEIGNTAGANTIVDSGTTSTYLPSYLYSGFDSAFQKAGLGSFSNIRLNSYDQCKDYPDLLFHFQGNVVVRMPCTAYIECWQGSCTPSVYFEGGGGAVLGASFMKGHDVVFDWEHQQVGFAEANCNYQSRR